jgi:hypothetical protein
MMEKKQQKEKERKINQERRKAKLEVMKREFQEFIVYEAARRVL